MGGYNSGRHGGRPTVGSGVTLDLYKLIRQGFLKPGQYRGGSIIWTRMRWRTYERETARIEAAEGITDAYLSEFVQRLQEKHL